MSRARDLAGIFNLNPTSGTTAQRPATADVGDIFYNGTTGKTQIYTPTGWQDMASGIPYGNTAGRPAAVTGQPYFNGENQRLELYTGTSWENIVQEVPGVSSISGNYSQQTDSGVITIYGTNFVSGAYATAIGSNGVQVNAASTVYNSLVQLTATFTGLSNANEPYDIKVTNPSNLFGLIPDALYVNASPVWQTASGSLGTFNEQVSITLSALSTTDSDSTTITYALASGSTLPSGVTLNSSTGVISGTLPDIATDTTYSFTVNATDGLNIIPRTFSLTSNSLVGIEYLVVAGGGGGGGAVRGGGGGAGGYRSSVPGELSGRNSSAESLFFRAVGNQFLVTVGNGGAAGPYDINNGAAAGQPGQNSILDSIISIGGGNGGASDSQGAGRNPGTGGSGGGGFYGWNGQPGAAGTAGQGFDGGTSSTSYSYGGGGGGAGGAGFASQPSGVANGSKGGPGLQSSITGTATYYAGGGSSAGYPGQGTTENVAGGIGGGGTGMNNTGRASGQDPANGTANTGGGGGASGNGGSGVVIIAYPNTKPALSNIPGTLTYDQPTRSGYRVYRFTSGSGTVTF